MIPSLGQDLLRETSVGMGQAVLAQAPAQLKAILGSCVAVALYAPRLQLGMLSHVVLPKGAPRAESPGKFADAAIPYMLSVLREHGAEPGRLVAKVAGGACMFGGSHFMDIGASNAKVVLEALEASHVSIAARDLGGTAGRRVSFDIATGGLTVASAGHSSRTI